MKETRGSGKRLVLIDAHAIIHRAYHALPDFVSSSGEPTGALYGLASMLIRIIQDLKPDYIAACFDLPEPTHRHEVFDGYKGTRKSLEDNLILQLNRARDVFTAFNIPIYEHPGFEADDCLGTIVHEVEEKKLKPPLEIIIASGDMDTLQLVKQKRVKVYTQRKGPNDIVLYDEDAVNERFGFGPTLIPDYKGLRGDPSDNIPGIKGIGEKTATALVQTFGSIEDIYKKIHKNPESLKEAGIKGKTAELVIHGEDEAVFSKMIATIRTDAPIKFEIPTRTWQESVDAQVIFKLFDDLGFRSLTPRAKALFGVKEKGEATTGVLELAPQKPVQVVDPDDLAQTAIALWLINSDISYPELDDVLRYGKTEDYQVAKQKIFADLKEAGRAYEVYETIEKPLIPIVVAMCKLGIKLDTPYLKTLSDEYHKKLNALSAQIYAAAGKEFNINSPKQLGDVLFDDLKLSSGGRQKKTAGGQRSTKEEELLKLADSHPIIQDILSYRELQKLVSTYIDTLPAMVDAESRLHTRFMQAGTTTGRMASLDPNLQNIPIKTEHGRRIRGAFVADAGYELLALDYSQIELRIAAALSQDPNLVAVFKEGGDVHAAVASQVFKVERSQVDREMRRRAKVINFGIIYGMGVNALRQNLGDGVTREEAAQFLSDYFDNFKGLAEYLETVKKDAARKGYTETLFGRRRNFAGFRSPLPYVRAQAERMAINAPIQGTAADIIKKAMVEVQKLITEKGWESDVRLLLQVHDELVFEVKKGKAVDVVADIAQKMEHVIEPSDFMGVPLKVEAKYGPNWGDMEGIHAAT